MEKIILNAELRQGIGKNKAKGLRQEGFIPAVVYKHGKDAQAIKLSKSDLIHLLHQHRLENAVINLKIKDGKQEKGRSCLVKEIQYDPIHGEVIHVDFNEISLTEEIKVNIPIVAKGEPLGVKQEGGSLEHVLWEVEVECLPTDIPPEIEVDVSQLKIGDAIHIKDINFPSGIKVLNEPEATVLHVVAPMKEEIAEEVPEGAEPQEPEVIKEKKEEASEGKETEKQEKEAKEEKKEK